VFAHRGARADAPENTLEAFELALRLGATGIESDAWLTADGRAVLDHDGVVGGRLRHRPIAQVDRADLPDHVPELGELYAACGADFELSLDLKDAAVAEAVVAAAETVGSPAPSRLWLCHPSFETLAAWRQRWPEVHLVHSTSVRHLPPRHERHAAELADAGIDAVNLHHTEWTGGSITLYHRFERLAFGWDAQFDHHIAELLDAGIDGVYSDHVERLVAAVTKLV
jgi:glycerophosphoryl diester phosphodiesterase